MDVNHSDDLGQTFSAPVAVNRKPEAISARGENRPKIVVSRDGRIYVSWTMPLQKRFSGYVRFSYSNDGGEHFSEPITVNDNLDITGHRFDALAVNDNGVVYLAWLDKRDRLREQTAGRAYHGAALYFALSDDGGRHFRPNRKIIDHSCECCRVAIDMDHQLPVIMWRNIYGDNVRDHSLVKFSTEDQPGAVERVSFDHWRVDACPHHGPDLSIADNGQYHLVWFNNAPQRHGLFYARRNTDGSYTRAVNFGDYSAAASHPSVINIGSRVWLAWKQFDGKQESIWLQYSADAGNSWQAARPLAFAGSGDYPFLLSDGSRVYVQWHISGQGLQLIPVVE